MRDAICAGASACGARRISLPMLRHSIIVTWSRSRASVASVGTAPDVTLVRVASFDI
jgi:hypothetical protein